ncbi:MAG: bifunctional adenosylcobinamide kinase/adenosylcobinamide-phosphate guanylyltransferase, partial [Synergistaceae bacterium]|nr:bifunctional adenosylcobinamide kinase/adenosylcobinamide-phosphate guanylyltransferase [Synergistaceae bacterium]
MLILISGQADSGKSLYAETRLSEFRSSPKIYVAMSKIVDEEMRERVKKHQAMRSGKGFITV